jgi:FlaA1/EpsC-like NDP-sugar epimerase
MGVYACSWRLFGLRDATLLATAVGSVTAFLLIGRAAMPVLVEGFVPVPFSIVALEGTLVLIGHIGLRAGTRVVDEHSERHRIRTRMTDAPKRALLVGAGRAGRMAAHELQARPDAGYRVVGFLDDDPARHGQVVEGVRVFGGTDDASVVAAATAAECFILTMASATRPQRRAAVERCSVTGLSVRTVPELYELLGGKVEITKIRPVRIEDLLGREVVQSDERVGQRVSEMIAGKRVLVTGAGGSIGSELCRQIADLGPERLVLFENNENNLFDIEAELAPKLGVRAVAALADARHAADVERIFEHHRPEVVFHAAAYKHVPLMEENPVEAVRNNAVATRIVAAAAGEAGVERFILVSTDKAVSPATVMGASKALAEWAVEAAQNRWKGTRYASVRFGNVLGSSGSVVPIFRRQIAHGGPLTVTDERMTRYFMTIPEAVQLIIRSGDLATGGEVFVLEMGDPVRIVDLAANMIRLAGLEPDVDIAIEIIGRRVGEKLHEELFNPGERPQPTHAEKIVCAVQQPLEPEWVESAFARIEGLVYAGDAAALAGAVAELSAERALAASSGAPSA